MSNNSSTDLTSRLVKYVKTCLAPPHSTDRNTSRDRLDPLKLDEQQPVAQGQQDPSTQDRQGPSANDRQDPVAREHILQEIRRTAEANGGRPLGRDRFLKETGIRQCDFIGRFWTRWGDAVREAGCTPNQFHVRYPDAFLLEKYAELTRSLGRIPTAADLLMHVRSDKTFPDATVFSRRFGSKAALVGKLAEHCRSREDLQDVALLCERHLSSLSPRRPAPASADCSFGFVYLMQSGRFFKIGRTNAAGRRLYELGLRLPEPVRSIHVIPTDDPPGIEAYWHNRFAAKRKNGEWFDLDPADVSAFKRRKFM